MYPLTSYGLARARIADLRCQAQRDALARAAAHLPSWGLQLSRNRIPGCLLRIGRQRRFGVQLWTLLHAQALLDGPATVTGGTRLIEDDHQRFTGRQEIPADRRLSDARATSGQDKHQFPADCASTPRRTQPPMSR
jgi:hypothetical protein